MIVHGLITSPLAGQRHAHKPQARTSASFSGLPHRPTPNPATMRRITDVGQSQRVL
jgi:hypothetical protein